MESDLLILVLLEPLVSTIQSSLSTFFYHHTSDFFCYFILSKFEKFCKVELLRSRGIIESVNNKLKFDCQIEHHRHRSPWNFFVNLISGIIAYAYDPCKPSVQITRTEKQKLLNRIVVHARERTCF